MKIEVGKRYLTNIGDIAFVYHKAQNCGDGFNYAVSVSGEIDNQEWANETGKFQCANGGLVKCLDDEIRITADDIGKRVKLRGGQESTIIGLEHHPVKLKTFGNCNINGRQINDKIKTNNDVVEILDDEPEEKGKANREKMGFIIELEYSKREEASEFLASKGIFLKPVFNGGKSTNDNQS